MSQSIVALIPARGGSVRVPRKNLASLNGKPLIVWTILAAQHADIFSGIYVSTEDEEIAAVSRQYGATVIDRPAELAADLAPDIGWVTHALMHITVTSARDIADARKPDAFALLRCTSPFRSPETIRAAWDHLQHHGSYAVDSLRAVEPCKQHPFKMWRECGEFIAPFYELVGISASMDSAPPHSMPTQAHTRLLAQNASLEMAWSRVVLSDQPATISGSRVLPWRMAGYEGVDINGTDDLEFARWLVETGRATLAEAG